MITNPSLTKFLEYLSPKYIGVTIADQKLRALDSVKGIFLTEDIAETTNILLPDSIWKHPTVIKKLVKKIFKTAGVQIWSYRPVVIFSVPPGTSQAENKAIYNCLLYAGTKSVYLLDDLILAALGSGVYQKEEGPVYHKRIYALVQKDATYLGIILAGGAFEVKTIAKGYDSFTKDDLAGELKKLVDNCPMEFPAQFQHRAVSKDIAQRLKESWQKKFDRQIFITAPERFKGNWGTKIDDYELIYTNDEELAISKGIEQFFPVLLVKKSPTGRKPLNPVQLYLLLFTLIAIVVMFILRK
jgi:hypothetical protein